MALTCSASSNLCSSSGQNVCKVSAQGHVSSNRYDCQVSRQIQVSGSAGISSFAERVGSVAERAATLAFFRLAFPDQFPAAQKWLARAGAVSAVGALAQEAGSRAEMRRGLRPRPVHGRKRSAWQKLWAMKQQWQHKLPQSLKEGTELER